MTHPPLSQLERRRVEAQMMARMFAVLSQRFGDEKALALIGEAVDAEAEAAGKRFAAAAPNGPSLEHFATFIDLMRAGNALDIDRREIQGDVFALDITRCQYAHMYIKEMGLSPELAWTISCRRDLAFAKGYSPHLQLARATTISTGGGMCPFRYVWTEDRTFSDEAPPTRATSSSSSPPAS
ncbi:L-2-amino-thiazoline-4-carboxylic acid hydrolase [Desulfobaculum sp.]